MINNKGKTKMKEKTKENLMVSDRSIVTPGEVLAEGMSYLPSGKAIRDGDVIIASVLGLASVRGRVIKVIPLAGRYIPKRGDAVIGEIVGVGKFGWRINIRSPFDADLNVAEASSSYIDTNRTPLDQYFNIGEYIFAGITEVTTNGYTKLTIKNRPYRRLREGIVVEVSPTKIPRIIGKQGSMIKMLKEHSGCDILVGQNGWVWLQGDNPKKQMLLVNAIKVIEEESHTSGLTDKIKKLLGGKK
jgi:exosome complex component RRP4